MIAFVFDSCARNMSIKLRGFDESKSVRAASILLWINAATCWSIARVAFVWNKHRLSSFVAKTFKGWHFCLQNAILKIFYWNIPPPHWRCAQCSTSDVFHAFSTIRRMIILCSLLILQHVTYEKKEHCLLITAVLLD